MPDTVKILRKCVKDGSYARLRGSEAKIVASLAVAGEMDLGGIRFCTGLKKSAVYVSLRKLAMDGFVRFKESGPASDRIYRLSQSTQRKDSR